MNISPLAYSSPSIENKVAHGSEQLEIVVHSAYNDDDTTNSSCSKDRKAKTITESFETITHVFTMHMTAFKEMPGISSTKWRSKGETPFV